MKKVVIGVVALVALTGCSSMDGQFGKETDEWTDKHGRVCTAMKWGESASIDCDHPEGAKP